MIIPQVQISKYFEHKNVIINLSISLTFFGVLKNSPIEMGLLSIHNICFGLKIRKLYFTYTLLSGGMLNSYTSKLIG